MLDIGISYRDSDILYSGNFYRTRGSILSCSGSSSNSSSTHLTITRDIRVTTSAQGSDADDIIKLQKYYDYPSLPVPKNIGCTVALACLGQSLSVSTSIPVVVTVTCCTTSRRVVSQ